jgi:8-oxo-dGTP pyrophosphatase MutT (NUDIX family)
MPAPWNGNAFVWRLRGRTDVWIIIEKTEFIDADGNHLGFDDIYKLTGGKKLPQDWNSAETAIREVEEETGYVILDVNDLNFLIKFRVSDGHFQDFFDVPVRKCRGSFKPGPVINWEKGEKKTYFWMLLDEALRLDPETQVPFLYGNHHEAGCWFEVSMQTRLNIAA